MNSITFKTKGGGDYTIHVYVQLRSISSLNFFLFVTSLCKELKFHAKKMPAIDCYWQQRFIDAIKLSLKKTF